MHCTVVCFRPHCHQSIKVLDLTIMFLIYVVGYKQQVNYGYLIVLSLGRVNRENDFLVPEKVNANVIISLKLAYYISIGRDWEFDSAPIELLRLLPQCLRYSSRISLNWI